MPVSFKKWLQETTDTGQVAVFAQPVAMPVKKKKKRKFFLEDKTQFVGTIKTQLGVPKTLWMGMPLLISNKKLGKHFIRTPTYFFVKDFDDEQVTLTNILDSYQDVDRDGNADTDVDDEISLDNGTLQEPIEITLSKEDFFKLQEPPPGEMSGGLGMI